MGAAELSLPFAQKQYTEELKLLPGTIPSNYFKLRIVMGSPGTTYEGQLISRMDGKPFEHLTRSMLLLGDPKGKSDAYINFATENKKGNDYDRDDTNEERTGEEKEHRQRQQQQQQGITESRKRIVQDFYDRYGISFSDVNPEQDD